MAYFYDTNALLLLQNDIYKNDEKFYISVITLQELEHIKTSGTKDEETKYQARKALHLLVENEDKYEIIPYIASWDDVIVKNFNYPLTPDMKIIYSAYHEAKDSIFVTFDLSCKMLAKSFGLNVQFQSKEEESYTGYKIIDLTELELATFYNTIANSNNNIYNLLVNQYLIVKMNGQTVDKYKWTGSGYEQVKFKKIKDSFFETKGISPKDDFQTLAIDSLYSNKITVMRGKAGSGKSYLGLGYLYSLFDNGKIDKIIIFCNPVATKDSCKLGFYPGSKDEKLLDSQIGNFLISKFGDRQYVEELIYKGVIVLVPMADCRGMDTTGMHAGVYVTEAQNTTIDIMKLLIQRTGEDSILVIEGDDKAQVDMTTYAGNNNGLRRLSEIFRGEDYYGEVTLNECHRSRWAAKAEEM